LGLGLGKRCGPSGGEVHFVPTTWIISDESDVSIVSIQQIQQLAGQQYPRFGRSWPGIGWW